MACLSVIEARLNKQTIIDIAGRLEGTQRPYITGKGQRDDVTRRVQIYEIEGKIVPEVRWYRRLQGSSSGSSSPASSSISSADSPKNKKRKTFFDAPEGPKKVKKQEKLRPGRLPALEKKRRPEPVPEAQDFAHVHPSMNEPDLFPSSLPRHPSAYYGPCDEKRESQSFFSAPSFPPSMHAFVNNSASASPTVPADVPITDAARHTAGHEEIVPDVSTGDYESLQDLGLSFSDMTWLPITCASSQ